MTKLNVFVPNEGTAKVASLTLIGRRASFSVKCVEEGYVFVIDDGHQVAFPKDTPFTEVEIPT